MVNKNRLIQLTRQLIKIDSENPPGDEEAIGRYVKKYLEKLGLKPHVYAFKKKRLNIVAVLQNKRSQHSLLITPHLDTVPSGKHWRFPPRQGRITHGKIYGLGATDCKGNLACALEALHSLIEEKISLAYTLLFAATADEESGSSLGLIPLLEKGILRPTHALVLDADNFSIIVCQKGLIHMKVRMLGERAHGAYPWRGKNAIDAAVAILGTLKRKAVTEASHKYLRPPTLNVGTIHGGDKVNIVADWCEFELDFRFLPGERADRIIAETRRIIKRFTTHYKIEIQGIQEPYTISEKHPLVTHLTRAFRCVGERPLIKGSEGATVITFFQKRKVPAVATGFGTEGCAHSRDEYVSIDNLYRGALALEQFLRQYTFKT